MSFSWDENPRARYGQAGGVDLDAVFNDRRFPGAVMRALKDAPTLRGQLAPRSIDPRVIAPTEQAWTPVASLNGWVNYGAPYAEASWAKSEAGWVTLRGMLRDGTATADTDLFVLPAPARPRYRKLFVTFIGGHVVVVDPDGAVNLAAPSASTDFVGLDGIAFWEGS